MGAGSLPDGQHRFGPLGWLSAPCRRHLAGRLGITIAETVWPDLVQAATIAEMKCRVSELAAEASHDNFCNDRDRFFRAGSAGQWRQLVRDEELPRFAARVAELAPADLAAWIHRPPLPAAAGD